MPRSFATITSQFFDSGKVQKTLDRKTLRVLSKFGAFVRRSAQFSMRSGKGTARPGQPPFAHGGKELKRLLFFSYDALTKTVFIGPIRFDSAKMRGVPRLMEKGGEISKKVKSGQSLRLKYKPHPFMEPAFIKNIGWVTAEYSK